MEPTTTQQPKLGEMTTVLLDVVLSVGGYYLLRACGVGVLWALAIPGILVGVLTLASTVKRRALDVVGLLVLVELALTLGLAFATDDPRIAACRQPFYILVGGVFCLATLFGRRPFTAVITAKTATFGDPVRARAFEQAWQEDPSYRRQMRTLAATIGSIMIVGAAVRVPLIYAFPPHQMDRALLLSNIAGVLMFVVIGVTSKKLITPARETVLRLVEELKATQQPQGPTDSQSSSEHTTRQQAHDIQ